MYQDINNNNPINNVKPIELLTKLNHPAFGKIWIANKDLEKDTKLFVRKCLLLFPRQPTSLEKFHANIDPQIGDKINVCLGCCQLTTSLCSLCGWPLHNAKCRKWTAQQHQDECLIFRSNYIDFEEYQRNPHVYDFIAILRMCLFKLNWASRSMWFSLIRRKIRFRPFDSKYENQIKNFVLAVCRLRDISEKEVSNIILLYHTHFFAVENENSDRKAIYASFLLAKNRFDLDIAVYPMPHSCCPNVKMVYSHKTITFTVLTQIKQKEILTINYISVPGSVHWLSQVDRQKFLTKRCYDKPCLCKICETYFSSKIDFANVDEYELITSRALKCNICWEGHMFLNERHFKWKCDVCHAKVEKKQGLEIEIKVEKLLSSKYKTRLGDIIRKMSLCQNQLHHCHRILHRKSLELLSNIADTFLYAMIDEDLQHIDIKSDIVTNIKDICRRIFQIEFEILKNTNKPSFVLALSAVIGTYIELLITIDALRVNCILGDLDKIVTEMSYRLFIGLHYLWNTFLNNEGFEDEFCSKLSNSCYRLLHSIKSSLKQEQRQFPSLPSIHSSAQLE